MIDSSYGPIHKKKGKKRTSGWDISGIRQIKRILLENFKNKSISENKKKVFFFQESTPFTSNELKQFDCYSLFFLFTTKKWFTLRKKTISEK